MATRFEESDFRDGLDGPRGGMETSVVTTSRRARRNASGTGRFMPQEGGPSGCVPHEVPATGSGMLAFTSAGAVRERDLEQRFDAELSAPEMRDSGPWGVDRLCGEDDSCRA